MTLKEVIEKYNFGNNDYELIKIFFKVNQCEEQAVKMLTEFSQEVIINQRYENWFIKEHNRYGHVLMLNEKVEFKDRMNLMNFHSDYISNKCLSEEGLKEIKKIFDKYNKEDFSFIDIYFLGYLQRNNIALYMQDCREYGDVGHV